MGGIYYRTQMYIDMDLIRAIRLRMRVDSLRVGLSIDIDIYSLLDRVEMIKCVQKCSTPSM